MAAWTTKKKAFDPPGTSAAYSTGGQEIKAYWETDGTDASDAPILASSRSRAVVQILRTSTQATTTLSD
jgi:hypothetical protein